MHELEPVLGQEWHSFRTGLLFHWQGAESSTSPTYDRNRLLFLVEGECWSLLPTTAELTYLIVVVSLVNLPELLRLLKIGPFKLQSVVEAPPTNVIGSLVRDQQGFGVGLEPGSGHWPRIFLNGFF